MLAQSSSINQGIFTLVIFAAIIIGVLFFIFYLTRQFMLWYWRVNEIVSLLRDIRDEITNLKSSSKQKSNKGINIICVHCGMEVSIDKEIFDSGEFPCPLCNKINYYKTPADIEEYINVKCKNCDSTVEVDTLEYTNKKFICPDCGKESKID